MDDTPTSKARPAETTTAPVTAARECENVAIAIAVIGRPTPSPDQFLPQAASTKSDESRSPRASGDVEIGGQPSIDYRPAEKDDRMSPCQAMSSVEDNADSFITTPSPFKKQVAALAGIDGDTSEQRKRPLDASDNREESEHPPSPGKVSTPAAFSMSKYRRDRLLSETLIHSPEPVLHDANVTDYDLLGREVMAAAPTASAMLSRSDGFDPMPTFLGIGMNVRRLCDSSTINETRYGGLDTSQFVKYHTQDAFQLPGILQAHLDETYAASSLILEQIQNAEHENAGGIVARTGQVFFQVTAYRPRSVGSDISAPGTTPPTVSFRSASSPRCGGGSAIEFDSESVVRGKTFEKLSYLTDQPASSQNSNKKTTVTARSRPLPLRKRKLKVYTDSDDEKYTSPTEAFVAQLPGDNKRILVRHNIRSDNDGERVNCRCMKSQCLKLYCDCFQQNLLCTSRCSCKSCKNRVVYAGPGGVRTKAVHEIIQRRPDAFQPRTRDADEGCRCKKNKCLKKYCVSIYLRKLCTQQPRRCRQNLTLPWGRISVF
ncbi:hypothetical protein ACHAXA_008339 [Cyclostephanos tholiformis]|uniref:CRC domain-containing protein n=1 Tax=Cyclostephanos tholiformis TaxID=382380 RepID=A0ABD3R6J4_9STRA